MSRYTKTDVVTGDSVKSDVNVQLGLIEAAIADTVSRVGDLPNTMSADLDMNSNQILNLPDAVTSGEPITLRQGLSTIDWNVAIADAKYYDTVALAVADATLELGDVVVIKGRANGIFDVVTVGTTENVDLPNGFNIIASTVDATKCIALRIESGFFDIRQIGVFPDSTTDHILAINTAIEILKSLGGGEVYFPGDPTPLTNYYRITKPIAKKTGVFIKGDGANTLIRNNETSSESPNADVFMIGSLAREDISSPAVGDNDFDFYACNAITNGDETVTLTTASNDSFFTEGQVVMVRSNNEVSGDLNRPYYDYNQLNVIEDVASGVLELRYPIDEDISSPFISDMVADDIYGTWESPRYAIRDAGIRDIAVYSEHGWWMNRSGFIDCILENITVVKSKGVVYGNGISHSKISNIKGKFGVRFVETGFCSGYSDIYDIEGDYLSDGTSLSGIDAISVGEQSKKIHIYNYRLNADTAAFSGLVRTTGLENRIYDGQMNCDAVTSQAVSMAAGSANNKNNDNSIRSVDFFAGTSVDRFINFSSPTGELNNNDVVGCRFFGTPSTGEACVLNGNDNIVDCYFEEGAFIDAGETNQIYIKEQHQVQSRAENVTSTTANNVLETITYTGGSLVVGDRFRLKMGGKFTGTTDTKNVEIRLNNTTTLASHSTTSADIFELEVEISIRTTTVNQRSMGKIYTDNAVSLSRVNLSDDIASDYDITFEAWQSGATDNIDVDYIQAERLNR